MSNAPAETADSQLLWRRREQEIALILGRISGGMQLRPVIAHHALNIVTRRHAIGIQILCGAQQVLEFHPLVAADARHRGRPAR